MKKRTSIKFVDDLMKEIEPLLEGTIFTTKTAFAAEAIKEKIEAVKKEQAEHSLKLLTDEFTDKQVQYRRYGINNIADLARTTIMNTENITELENKLEAIDKKVKEDRALYEEMKKISDDFERDSPEEANKVLIGYAEKHLSKLKKEGIRIRKQVKN